MAFNIDNPNSGMFVFCQNKFNKINISFRKKMLPSLTIVHYHSSTSPPSTHREEPRTANVIAVADQVVCYVVEREKFMKLIGGLEFEKYNDNDVDVNA